MGINTTRPDFPTSATLRRSRSWLVVLVLGLVIVVGGALAVTARFGRSPRATPLVSTVPEELSNTDARRLETRSARAEAQLRGLTPRGVYIVVDSYRNRLKLFRGETLLRSAVCSTGTGVVLRDPRNGREWVFDTPTGERTVLRKVRNPVWAKPDWAFIEEGQLPPKDPNERFDNVSLGDYALYMGDGYIIHGTLFQSLLGRRVTHGCIRLGDEDLKFVYQHTPIGARVFLY